MRLPRLAFVSLVGLLATAVLVPADELIPDQKARAKFAAADFEKKKKAARETALKAFDKMASEVKKSRVLEAVKRDKLNQIETAKAAYRDRDEFPAADEYAGIEARYLIALFQAFRPLGKLSEEAFKVANKSGKPADLEAAKEFKQELEVLLPASARLEAGSLYLGRVLYFSGTSARSVSMRVEKVTDAGYFTVRVVVRGASTTNEFTAEGQRIGIGIELATTQTHTGSAWFKRAVCVIGKDRILGQTDYNEILVIAPAK
jgi:hypothetical protein